jgi:hypothetical protein
MEHIHTAAAIFTTLGRGKGDSSMDNTDYDFITFCLYRISERDIGATGLRAAKLAQLREAEKPTAPEPVWMPHPPWMPRNLSW